MCGAQIPEDHRSESTEEEHIKLVDGFWFVVLTSIICFFSFGAAFGAIASLYFIGG